MGENGSSQLGYQQHTGESMVNNPSSGLNRRPMVMHPGSDSEWDPMVSLCQSRNFDGLTKSSSVPNLLESHGINSLSHLVNYPSDPNLAQFFPKLSMFENENIHEHLNSFGVRLSSQNPNAPFPQNNAYTKSAMDDKAPSHVTQAERVCQVPEGITVGVSPTGKRKRNSEPNSPATKMAEENMQKGSSCDTLGTKEQDGKRQKSKQNTAANSFVKQAGKQVEDNSLGEEASKQDYIHVRARRGQATNSHSLAERVRREKISERMRLLQDLVPGCNKITGKAVMLDEIINYVQSLQHQVEFLSMKLATVNPELNLDIEHLLSNDIFQSRGSSLPIPGFDQGISCHGLHKGISQTMTNTPNTPSQYHHMPQSLWDSDLQSLLQMHCDSYKVGGLGSNGSSKTQL